MMKPLRTSLVVAAVMAAASTAHGGTVSLTNAGYSDNFSELGASATVPNGWAVYNGESGTSNQTWTTSIVANGSSGSVQSMIATTTAFQYLNTTTPTYGNGGFNAPVSLVTTGATNHVLGTDPTGVDGDALQLTLTNNTGAALSSVDVSYNIVRFNNGTAQGSGNNNDEELPGYELFYSTNGSTWTNVSDLNPTLIGGTNPDGTPIPAVGASAGVTAVPTYQVNLGTSVANGSNLELRWVDDNAIYQSPDQDIGITNLDISPVPMPATLPLMLAGLAALRLLGRRSNKVPTAGIQPEFGFFEVEGIIRARAGQRRLEGVACRT